jgi:hypothetical protein
MSGLQSARAQMKLLMMHKKQERMKPSGPYIFAMRNAKESDYGENCQIFLCSCLMI